MKMSINGQVFETPITFRINYGDAKWLSKRLEEVEFSVCPPDTEVQFVLEDMVEREAARAVAIAQWEDWIIEQANDIMQNRMDGTINE